MNEKVPCNDPCVVMVRLSSACWRPCGTTESKEAAENTPVAAKGVEAVTFDGNKTGLNTDIKIGIVLVGDETEGYTAAHMNGLKEAMTTLGIDPPARTSCGPT